MADRHAVVFRDRPFGRSPRRDQIAHHKVGSFRSKRIVICQYDKTRSPTQSVAKRWSSTPIVHQTDRPRVGRLNFVFIKTQHADRPVGIGQEMGIRA